MKIDYFPETDSLYIELAARPGADAEEIDTTNLPFRSR